MLDQHARATMTVEEAARIVGISRSAAYRAVATGQPPSIGLNGLMNRASRAGSETSAS